MTESISGTGLQSYPFGPYVEPEGPPERTAGRWNTANENSNKFQLVDFPPLPGKCAACGYAGGADNLSSEYQRQFVDWNFDIDLYGVVVLCTVCVTEMSKALGFISIDEVRATHQELDRLSVENQELRNANTQLRDTVHLLTGSSDSSPDSAILTEDVHEVTSDGEREIEDSEFVIDEFTGEPRRDDVSSITSDNAGNIDSIDI